MAPAVLLCAFPGCVRISLNPKPYQEAGVTSIETSVGQESL